MHLTLVLGDQHINRRLAAERAIALSGFAPGDFDLIDVDPTHDAEYGGHANPSFGVRLGEARRRWAHALKAIRSTSANYVVVPSSAYIWERGGPELVFPTSVFRLVANHVQKLGGSVEIVVLIDEVFDRHNVSSDAISRSLVHRQLEWTFAQYLGSQFRSNKNVRVHCFAANHPAQNLVNVVSRRTSLAAYVCHPINAFRRDRDHPDRSDLQAFRKSFSRSLTLLDPLGIDEEALISSSVGVHTETQVLVPSADRWPPPALNTILPQPEEWLTNGLTLPLPSASASHIGRLAKAQIPDRDFYWIDMCNVLIAWRPFLGGVHHAGVLSEIQYALHTGKRVFAFSPEEDGGEHPSPFASMMEVCRSLHDLNSRLSGLAARLYTQDNTMTENPPKYCDHTSVGVLIYNDQNELLLIERGTFPFGMAVPAGHVDEHRSFEEAAIAEVREEVGLDIADLKLVAEGRRENPCRRLNGSWHYWKIFEAQASGTVSLSPREARRAEWCSPKRLMELGLVTARDGDATSGLERVWLDWLTKLEIVHPLKPPQPQGG